MRTQPKSPINREDSSPVVSIAHIRETVAGLFTQSGSSATAATHSGPCASENLRGIKKDDVSSLSWRCAQSRLLNSPPKRTVGWCASRLGPFLTHIHAFHRLLRRGWRGSWFECRAGGCHLARGLERLVAVPTLPKHPSPWPKLLLKDHLLDAVANGRKRASL
jgi:hypothetical protein